MYYIIFRVFVFLLRLLSSYCDIWFVVDLLRRSVFRRFVVTFYLYKDDLEMQNGFDQLNILNYER